MPDDKDPFDLSGVEMKMPEENFFGEPEPPKRSYFGITFLMMVILILGATLFVLLWFGNPLSFLYPVSENLDVTTELATTTDADTGASATTTVSDSEESESLSETPIFRTESSFGTSTATSTLDTATSTATTSTPLLDTNSATSTEEAATSTASSTDE